MNRLIRRAVMGVSTVLVLSMSAAPVLAETSYVKPDESTSAATSDQTFLGGLDLEAQIISSAEQDVRSPYAKTGVATGKKYLKIFKKANSSSEVVGKLYEGYGCEILGYKGSWTQIKSGDVEGYVLSKYIISGTDAEDYAKTTKDVSLVATRTDKDDMYLHRRPDAGSRIVGSVAWDEELKVLGASKDRQWVRIKISGKTGYIPADSVILDVKYEEAISKEQEEALKKAEEERLAEEARKAEEERLAREAAEAEEAEAEQEEADEEATEPEADEVQESGNDGVSITDCNETVWATYSVSIRESWSAESDKLDVLEGGHSITRTGKCDNGWSRVDYYGQDAYIKSEYLTTEEPVNDGADEADEDLSETVYAAYGVNVRSKASTDGDVLGTLYPGQSITRTGYAGDWSRVDYNGQTGYVKSEYLTKNKPKVEEPEPEPSNNTSEGYTIEDRNDTVYATTGVNIRAKADANSEKIGSLAAGYGISRTGRTSNGWSRVEWSGKVGFICNDYLTTTKPAQPDPKPSGGGSSSSDLGQQIVNFAVQYVGYPYVYGGNSLTGGVDCSGFTQQVYLHFGYTLERRASLQALQGSWVSISDLQPGDLVFYGDGEVEHVTIYIGGGQVVHASSPSTGIIISNMYYRTPYTARRII